MAVEGLPDIGKDKGSRPTLDQLHQTLRDFQSIRDYIDQQKKSDLYRILVDRNIDPEVGGLFRNIPSLRKPIDDGRLNFHLEAPGFNSNRYYFGLKYNLR